MTTETQRLPLTESEVLTLADDFWGSSHGKNVGDGLRLDRALPAFLADRIRFVSDEDIEQFYGEARTNAGSEYERVRAAVMALWPDR